MDVHPARVRVAVVNDFPIVAAGLARLLEDADPRFTVTSHVRHLPARGQVDVVLFDTFGHGPRGAARLRQIAQSTGAAVVVFGWAVTRTATEVRQIHEEGATAFISKTGDGHRLAQQLRDVLRRSGFTAATDDGAPADSRRMPAWPGAEYGLSEREAEVICLICDGLTNKAIAATLYVSVNSIKTYIRSAYRKIAVTRRSEAVLWGVDHGMRKESREPSAT